MDQPRIIIIGGGVAGLGAALRLGRSGRFAPVILEREKQAGGLARSLHFKGVSTDLGPHRLHTELPEVYDLVSEVAAPSLYTVRRKSRIYLRGKYLDYPPKPLEAMAHLGPFRMARFGLSMAAEMLRPEPDEETYETMMRRAFGAGLYNFMLRPYSAKVWKTDPADIHVDTAKVRVSAGSLMKMAKGLLTGEKKGQETSLKEFRYVKGGVETLVRHLREHAEAAGAEVKTASEVRALDLEPGPENKPETWRVRAARVVPGPQPDFGPTAERQDHTAESTATLVRGDAFVSTAPLPVLMNRLLPAVPELAEAREASSSLTYINMIFVLIIVKRKVISGDNWLYYPDPEFIFNRAYESKTFDPEMGPEDRSVLCVELTVRPGDDLERESDESISNEVVDQMTSTGLFGKDEVDETLVYRLPYGYPLYSLDYPEKLDTVFAGLRKIKNLLTSGRQGLFNHNNTDHSILMGLRSADCLIEHGTADPADPWYNTVDDFKHFRIVD